MLVLTRKQGERILIGDDIVLKVVGIDGNRVRLAFDAPSTVRILRGELMPSAAALPLKGREKHKHRNSPVPLTH